MAENTGVVFLGQDKVEIQSIDFPKMQNPAGKKINHAVILKVVSTNICGSDQHMVRGRTTAPPGMVLGHEITGEVIEKGPDVEMLEIEAALLHPDFLVGAFQHREIQVFLVADVVIQHALVGAGFRGNAIDPRAGEAMRDLAAAGAKDVCVLAADDTEEWLPADQLQPGQRFVVRPGERIGADGLSVTVYPAFLYPGHPLASVNGPFNAVTVESEAITEITMSGPGAGGPQTGSAVLGDVISAMIPPASTPPATESLQMVTDVVSAFYLYLVVADEPAERLGVGWRVGRNAVDRARDGRIADGARRPTR